MGEKEMDTSQMVECHYEGTTTYIPVNAFLRASFNAQFSERKYVRYKEGAKLFGMSERAFYNLAHDAGAVYHYRKVALVNLDTLYEFMEFYKDYDG